MKLHEISTTLCLSLLTACGSSGTLPASPNEPPAPPPPEPPPPGNEFAIHGEVFSFDSGMIPSAEVSVWTIPAAFDTGWYSPGPQYSNALGLFESTVSGPSYISVFAYKERYVQPCAVQDYVEGDVEVRVEMLPQSALESVNPPLPQLSSDPSLTGTVFEWFEGERQIISGAQIWIDDWQHEVAFAYTYSDLAGHYYLCRLPPGAFMTARKSGYLPRTIGPIDTSEPVVLDVELERGEL